MFDQQPPPPSDGSRDCGTFFLDVVGHYRPGDLSSTWTTVTRDSNERVEGIIAHSWAQQRQLAAECGRRLFNGSLCRLNEFHGDQQTLSLNLGPVSFKEFLGTNLTHAYIRYIHGGEVLANPLGVSAAPVTADGFILLGRRSQRVLYHAGRIHPIGGMVEPAEQGPPDPFASMLAEIVEETNVPAAAVHLPACLGLVRDKHIVQPELVFEAQMDLSVAQVREAAASALDAEEHSAFVPVRNHPSAVISFIEQNFAELTPLGTATLLLHGLQNWGSGWFAASRGYLRSVI
jgi:hypothetical protein